ncbi:MAG TPA: endolytic transglycosylase MltG [Bacteroidota bacterium]|nr:endolytic transglycosylase MltG [Bacteroidota bacterium]
MVFRTPKKGSGRKRHPKRLAWSLPTMVVLALGGISVVLWAPNTFDGDRIITVSKGDTFRQIEDTLVTSGVVRNRFLFNLAARILGSTRRMQIGRYRFRSGMSNSRILEDLEFGKSVEPVMVTVPEGYRTRRLAALFRRNLGLDTAVFMSLVQDTAFIRRVGLDPPTLEGYLLPDTYQFYWQESEETVLSTMAGAFAVFFNDSLRAGAGRRGMGVHQVLTLASIIEAETSVDSERTRISGVYSNRLRKRMRLQADPTVQYILEDGPRRLSYSDLHRSSPYNTYRNAGLPPGPINNPGRASILAAIYPEKHGFYFFVANGEGGHTFSRTYAEHLREVRKYQRRREAAAAAASAELSGDTLPNVTVPVDSLQREGVSPSGG